MYELIELGIKTYYIESPVKTGIYKMSETEVLLIDSGNDKDAAKKILKILAEENWNLSLIINTHSHADHIGGNAYLVEKTGCKILSVGIETAFIKYPELESSFLYGAYPPKPLRNKFLMAKASNCEAIEDYEAENGKIEGIEWTRLDGHTIGMIGIKTSDDVWFIGDAVNGPHIIEKYHVSFVYDIKRYLETFEHLKTLEGRKFVAAHSKVVDELSELVQVNLEKTLEIINLIQNVCRKPMTFEQLLKAVFDHYELNMDINQYVLVGTSVKAYLSYLYDEGKMTYGIDENQLKWTTLD